MAWLQQIPGMAAMEEQAERAWRTPLGAVSPLWATFGAAAGAGVAWWWMTRWTSRVNVEALAALSAPLAATRIEILAEPPAPEAPVEVPAEDAMEPEPVVIEVEAAPAEAEPTVAEAEPLAEPEPPAAPDDLTRMVGIGPKLSEALAARGVTRFADIAAWTEADLAEVDAALALKGRAVREAWVDQARKLAAGD